MRVFAISDLHVDHLANRQWIEQLSQHDYRDDVLILAGDVSDSLDRLEWCMRQLANRFYKVLFVPGNHELWVVRDAPTRNSLDKFALVRELAGACAVGMEPFVHGDLAIVPLLGWYDYSFGQPDAYLRAAWGDYRACRWPPGLGSKEITDSFLDLNTLTPYPAGTTVISFSHFVPRRDLLPPRSAIPLVLDPVLGCVRLDEQVRALGARIHVYGHIHIAQRRRIDDITYINNALGNPRERRLAATGLVQLHACSGARPVSTFGRDIHSTRIES